MLHYETIDQPTLDLLKRLQSIKQFSELRLVGGTALALQYGHRKSIDIDLFGKQALSTMELLDVLSFMDNVVLLNHTPNIHQFSINGIKVDIVNYQYQWLALPIIEDNMTLANTEDIGAMKLSAIIGRGTKKDFVDLYFLLKHYTLSSLLSFFRNKYPDGTELLVLKSLIYFQDADEEVESPVMLIDVKWEEIKKTILHHFKNYTKGII